MKLNDIFPSKYLKASDIEGETVAVIKGVQMEQMKDQEGNEETKPVLYFTEYKPMVLNMTNARAIESLYGDDTDVWPGNQVTLFVVEVSAFGKTTPALRIRDAKSARLTAIKRPAVQPASAAPVADRRKAVSDWNEAAATAKHKGKTDLVDLYRPAANSDVAGIVKATNDLNASLMQLVDVPAEALA